MIYKPSFVFHNISYWVSFHFENPLQANGFLISWQVRNLPSLVLVDSIHFFLHGLLQQSSSRACSTLTGHLNNSLISSFHYSILLGRIGCSGIMFDA
jgi:hypothetical protein